MVKVYGVKKITKLSKLTSSGASSSPKNPLTDSKRNWITPWTPRAGTANDDQLLLRRWDGKQQQQFEEWEEDEDDEEEEDEEDDDEEDDEEDDEDDDDEDDDEDDDDEDSDEDSENNEEKTIPSPEKKKKLKPKKRIEVNMMAQFQETKKVKKKKKKKRPKSTKQTPPIIVENRNIAPFRFGKVVYGATPSLRIDPYPPKVQNDDQFVEINAIDAAFDPRSPESSPEPSPRHAKMMTELKRIQTRLNKFKPSVLSVSHHSKKRNVMNLSEEDIFGWFSVLDGIDDIDRQLLLQKKINGEKLLSAWSDGYFAELGFPHDAASVFHHALSTRILGEQEARWEREAAKRKKTAAVEKGLGTSPSQEWGHIRMYIASTEPDFQFERQYLATKMMQSMSQLCNRYGFHFSLCDLRSGTTPLQWDSQVKLAALHLREIDRCKKYSDKTMDQFWFLYLGGSYFGQGISKAETESEPLLQERWVDGNNITAMEILEGAIQNSSQNTIFCLRDPALFSERLFLEAYGHEEQSHFQDVFPDGRKNLYLYHKQLAMQSFIRRKYPSSQIVDYKLCCTLLRNSQGYPGLNFLDSNFQSKILHWMEKRTEKLPKSTQRGQYFDLAIRNHQEYWKCSHRQSVDFHPQVANFFDFALGDTPLPAYICSDTGTGKTTLLCSILSRHRELEAQNKRETILIPACCRMALKNYRSEIALLRYICHEIARILQIEQIELSSDEDDACRAFVSYIDAAGKIARTVENAKLCIVIDSLECLVVNESQTAKWVPMRLPANVTMVLLTRPTWTINEVLLSKRGAQLWKLPPPKLISHQETVFSVFCSILSRHAPSPSVASVAYELSKGSPLWLTLFSHCINPESIVSMHPINSDVKQFPENIEVLSLQFIRGLDTVVCSLTGKPKQVYQALMLLACSETGLKEMELKALMEENTPKESVTSAHWCVLMQCLDFCQQSLGASTKNNTILNPKLMLEQGLHRLYAHVMTDKILQIRRSIIMAFHTRSNTAFSKERAIEEIIPQIEYLFDREEKGLKLNGIEDFVPAEILARFLTQWPVFLAMSSFSSGGDDDDNELHHDIQSQVPVLRHLWSKCGEVKAEAPLLYASMLQQQLQGAGSSEKLCVVASWHYRVAKLLLRVVDIPASVEVCLDLLETIMSKLQSVDAKQWASQESQIRSLRHHCVLLKAEALLRVGDRDHLERSVDAADVAISGADDIKDKIRCNLMRARTAVAMAEIASNPRDFLQYHQAALELFSESVSSQFAGNRMFVISRALIQYERAEAAFRLCRKSKEIISWLLEAAASFRHCLGLCHPDFTKCMLLVASATADAGLSQQAMKACQEVKTAIIDYFGPNSSFLIEIHAAFVEVFSCTEQYDEALTECQKTKAVIVAANPSLMPHLHSLVREVLKSWIDKLFHEMQPILAKTGDLCWQIEQAKNTEAHLAKSLQCVVYDTVISSETASQLGEAVCAAESKAKQVSEIVSKIKQRISRYIEAASVVSANRQSYEEAIELRRKLLNLRRLSCGLRKIEEFVDMHRGVPKIDPYYFEQADVVAWTIGHSGKPDDDETNEEEQYQDVSPRFDNHLSISIPDTASDTFETDCEKCWSLLREKKKAALKMKENIASLESQLRDSNSNIKQEQLKISTASKTAEISMNEITMTLPALRQRLLLAHEMLLDSYHWIQLGMMTMDTMRTQFITAEKRKEIEDQIVNGHKECDLLPLSDLITSFDPMASNIPGITQSVADAYYANCRSKWPSEGSGCVDCGRWVFYQGSHACPTFECGGCGYKNRYSEIMAHIAHSRCLDRIPASCMECKSPIRNQRHLGLNSKSCSSSLSCPLCGRIQGFSSIKDLRQHCSGGCDCQGHVVTSIHNGSSSIIDTPATTTNSSSFGISQQIGLQCGSWAHLSEHSIIAGYLGEIRSKVDVCFVPLKKSHCDCGGNRSIRFNATNSARFVTGFADAIEYSYEKLLEMDEHLISI